VVLWGNLKRGGCEEALKCGREKVRSAGLAR